MDDVSEKVREGQGKKIGMYCHLQEFTLRRNILLRDNSPWSLVFLHVLQVKAVSAFVFNCVFQDICTSYSRNIALLWSKG